MRTQAEHSQIRRTRKSTIRWSSLFTGVTADSDIEVEQEFYNLFELYPYLRTTSDLRSTVL